MQVYGPVSRKQVVIQSLAFHTNKVIQQSSKGMGEIKYSQVEKLEVKESYLLIFIGSSEFLFVPSDAFNSPQDREEVISRMEYVLA